MNKVKSGRTNLWAAQMIVQL